VGIGGGSVIDAGKAIAALAGNPGDVLDYLEVVGGSKALSSPSLPFVAIPTTAGTGAEVTRNAVIMSPEHQVKVSLRSPHMLPRLALVDPELTYSLPPAETAATGLDALTQLIEPFVSIKANPMTDGFCQEGIVRVARSLRSAYQDGSDAAARQDMSLAALFGGLALANAGLGAVHGFAGAIGGMFPASHGAVCAALLPHVMNANVRALRQREPDNPVLDRYREIAQILTGATKAKADDGIAWTQHLLADLQIPHLGEYGIRPKDVDVIVAKAQPASSMRGNPIKLTDEELRGILVAAL
jgi:alcohol dehydrogenase class IV